MGESHHVPYRYLFLGLLGSSIYIYFQSTEPNEPPVLKDEYFGKGKVPDNHNDFPKDNPAIRKFQINVSEDVLKDLKTRLQNTRFIEPLCDVQFQYGFHSLYLKEVVDYWKNKFDWRKQEIKLNKLNHFITQIEGIDVHFIHQKPHLTKHMVKVYPVLLVHGWPGSAVEFAKILPLLTNVRNDQDFVFEVVCPSIPGYGFSEAPHQPGFNPASAARIFSKLMTRLGFEKFYTHGGDWGTAITSTMAIVYPERVLGAHFTFLCDKIGFWGLLKYAVGYIYPPLFMHSIDAGKLYPISTYFGNIFQEIGFFLPQSTKPDTIGVALSDSPAGLAAYMLQKFSSGTDLSFRELKDGGLTKKFTLDDLITNVMIYWTTNTISSSMRFYKEAVSPKFLDLQLSRIPIKVPVGIVAFPNELLALPKAFIEQYIPNITTYTYMPRGGHFAAMEEPELLANDIRNFVFKIPYKKI